jgi:WD40 repeat protein
MRTMGSATVPEIELLKTWRAAKSRIVALEFVRTDSGINVLAAAAQHGLPTLWRPETGQPHTPDSLRAGRTGLSDVYDLVRVPRSGAQALLAAVVGRLIAVFDVATGYPAATVETGSPGLYFVESLQHGDGTTTIVAAGREPTVHLWDGAEGGTVRQLEHDGPVSAIKVLRGQRWLAVAHADATTVWDLSGSDPTEQCLIPGTGLSALAVIHNAFGEPRLASASPRGIEMWDPVDGRLLTRFGRHSASPALAVVNSPEGEPLLAAADNRTLQLWSAAAGTYDAVHELPGRILCITKILAGDGTTLLAAGDEQGNVAVWRLPAVVTTAPFERKHRGWVNCLVASPADRPGGPLLASASDDGTTMVWDVERQTGRELVDAVGGRRPQVQAITFVGPDHVATGDEAGRVRLWSVDTGKLVDAWDGGRGPIRAMAQFVGPDAVRHLVTAGAEGHVVAWSVGAAAGPGDGTGARPQRDLRSDGAPRTALMRAVAAIALPDGRPVVIAGASTGHLLVWDGLTGQSVAAGEMHHGAQVRAVAAVRMDNQVLVASGGDDGIVRLWDMATATCLREVEAHTGLVSALAIIETTSGGWLLASGGADRAIRVWDPATLELVGERPYAHGNWVRALAQVRSTSPVPHLASGGDDGGVRVWEQPDRLRLLKNTRHVSLRGFGDRPSRRDLLGREHIVDELADLMQRPVDPSAPHPTTGPQVVTIEGPWGSGKTSAMNDLRWRLDSVDRSATKQSRGMTPRDAMALVRVGRDRTAVAGPSVRTPAADDKTRIVSAWFNPWAHQSSEQVWAGLAWTIIRAVNPILGTTAKRQRYWLAHNADRLDRAAVRRTLRQRIWLPTQAVALAWLLPLTLALANRAVTLNWIMFGALSAVLAALAVRAVDQYLNGEATDYLPPDMFEGPVAPSTLAARTDGQPLTRNPLYDAEAGQLHRTQRDIYQLIEDVRRLGYQLVVFVDDLDRCSKETTGEVFESINGFLHGTLAGPERPDRREGAAPGARFVIGINPTVVALRIAESHSRRVAEAVLSPDGLEIGWAYLNKLAQLSVVLPATPAHHGTRLLRYHTSVEVGPASPQPTAVEQRNQAAAPARRWWARPYRRRAGAASPPRPADPVRLNAIESEPAFQERLSQLVSLRPTPSVRETKRLLTEWVFYMGLLGRLDLLTTDIVHEACDVLAFAEILCRWPSLISTIGTLRDGETVLRRLIRDATSEAVEGSDSERWRQTLHEVGLGEHSYEVATNNLYRLLRQFGTPMLAELADTLL